MYSQILYLVFYTFLYSIFQYYTMGSGSFPGVKRPWRGVGHPPPPNTEIKDRLELFIYSPFGLSWPVLL